MDKVLSHISQYVNSITYDDLPDEVIHQTKRLWIDTLACTPRAFESLPIQIGLALAEKNMSKDPATVLWGQQKTSAELAAFINSSMVRYLDFNDFYQGPEAKESGHPSDALPSALSIAEQEGKTGKEVVLGSVIAWEIYARLSDRVAFRDYGFDQSIAIAIAATCAASKVLGLSQEQIANAVALTTASSITLGEVRFGEVSMWKGCAAANGVRNGVFSASLAKHGMTGPLHIFDGPRGFFNGISGPCLRRVDTVLAKTLLDSGIKSQVHPHIDGIPIDAAYDLALVNKKTLFVLRHFRPPFLFGFFHTHPSQKTYPLR